MKESDSLMTTEEYLLALLRASLWQREKVPVATSQLLGETFALAREHTVAALVAHPFISGQAQLTADPESGAGRQALVMQMMQVEQTHKALYAKFSHLLRELASLFRRHGIRYVVFKGRAVASRYPVPYLRTMGDVDFYVVPEDFMRAQRIIEQEWHIVIERDDLDKHDSFSYHGVRFEMHRRIETFGRTRAQRVFDAWMESTVSCSASSIPIGDEHLSVLPPVADVIVVFKHLFNHLLVEGVGLRQVADLAMLLGVYQSSIDRGALREMLHQLGYLRAFDVMVALLHQYLGLACADTYAPLTDKNIHYADQIYRMIMDSGNFGRKAYTHHAASCMKSMETAYRAFRYCLFALKLIPSEMMPFILRRIGITVQKYRK